ncbi:MAG: alpha/beta fold hydrolase [Candidatus Hodarchaeota archaeon]
MYFDYSGKKIYYQIKNNNSQNAIIFIHGSGGNSNIWREQFNLNIDCNVFALDLPSHNKSDEFLEHSLKLYIDVVREFVETLDLKNVILSGHSLGGAVIQSYYFKYPNDVRALILIGTGGRLRVLPSILETVKNDFQKFIADMDEDLRKEYLKTAPNVVYDDFKICDGFDTLDKTNLIKIPCLILVGKEDAMTPVKYAEFFHKKINISELVIIEEARHFPMVEKPKELNKAIENFISNYF